MAAQNNKVAAAWLDLRSDRTELWGAMSIDDGKTWSKNFLIYRSPSGHICECCHPSLVFAPSGKLYAMWRNWLGGSRDLYIAQSNDGMRFAKPKKLGTGSWPLQACPMDGGSLTLSADGSPVSIWRRNKQIFEASIGSPEKLISVHGAQPVAAGPYYIWQSDAQLMFARRDETPALITDHGAFPSIAAFQNGAVAVWETGDANSPIAAKILR
jgi:hypothetical protein